MRTRLFALLIVIICLTLLFACGKPGTQQSENPPAQTEQSGANAPARGTSPASRESGARSPATAAAVTLPAGTELTVRLAEAVGSKISQSGEPFTAHVATPVEKDGKLVVPAGSEVTGHVTQAVPLGRFKGGAKLALAVDELVVGGKKYPISGSVVRAAKGKGKRTATMIGGGAGVGALIGGLAGGGKGAAIGALAGAGAGTAGSAFTGNKNIVLPAESALTFKLNQPLTIQ